MPMRLRHFPFCIPAMLLALSLGISGCLDADTRGGEVPDEVVISGTPTWSNGIGELMALKCAVCHQVPAGRFSPAGVPSDLDLNFQNSTASGIRGAADILTFIDGGILRSSASGVRQMPLEYATPLTGQEIQALEAWSRSDGP